MYDGGGGSRRLFVLTPIPPVGDVDCGSTVDGNGGTYAGSGVEAVVLATAALSSAVILDDGVGEPPDGRRSSPRFSLSTNCWSCSSSATADVPATSATALLPSDGSPPCCFFSIPRTRTVPSGRSSRMTNVTGFFLPPARTGGCSPPPVMNAALLSTVAAVAASPPLLAAALPSTPPARMISYCATPGGSTCRASCSSCCCSLTVQGCEGAVLITADVGGTTAGGAAVGCGFCRITTVLTIVFRPPPAVLPVPPTLGDAAPAKIVLVSVGCCCCNRFRDGDEPVPEPPPPIFTY